MRYAFIRDHRGEFDVAVMCEVLEVVKSGFYDWQSRDHDVREARRNALVEKIATIHQGSRGSYGSPRVFKALKGLGEKVSKPTVEKLMRESGIRAKTKRKFKATTNSKHSLPVVENVAGRRFAPGQANKLWCADITFLWTDEGWLYLAAIIDCGTRKVVGWAMGERMTAELCLSALKMAVDRQRPGRGLIHHSDRGSQYASRDYQQELWRQGMTPSMSGKGNCYDNAVVESFFHTLKTELVYHERYRTRSEARANVFEWVEVFYNRSRMHSALGYVSPECYERRSQAECA